MTSFFGMFFWMGPIACDTSGTDTGCDPCEDSEGAHSSPAAESGDTGDTGSDPPPDPCEEPVVLFTTDDGRVDDLTDALTAGDYTELNENGTLSVCPGTWYTRLLLRADIHVLGLGKSHSETILSGGQNGTILDISGNELLVTVENVTLDRGAGLDVDHNSGGGGIYCEEGAAVFVEDATFSTNFANDGAALYARECSVDLRDVTFRNNVSEDDGGALTLWYSEGNFADVTFEDNIGLDGGALAAFYSDLTIQGASFRRNTSGYFAGGLWIYDSTLTMSDTQIAENTNTGQDAGGMLVHGTATLTRVDFSDNSAPQGGGLFVYYEAIVDGEDCDFSGNDPDPIWVADYGKEGGTALDVGEGASFSCAENVCTTQ